MCHKAQYFSVQCLCKVPDDTVIIILVGIVVVVVVIIVVVVVVLTMYLSSMLLLFIMFSSVIVILIAKYNVQHCYCASQYSMMMITITSFINNTILATKKVDSCLWSCSGSL